MRNIVELPPPVRKIDYLCVWWNVDDQLCYTEGTVEECRASFPAVFRFTGMFKTCCAYPFTSNFPMRELTGGAAYLAVDAFYRQSGN